MKTVPLNWGLISNPFNWAKVIAILLIGGVLYHVVASYHISNTKGA